METKGDIKKYVNDIKDLPLWLKWIIAILTLISIVYGLLTRPSNTSTSIRSHFSHEERSDDRRHLLERFHA